MKEFESHFQYEQHSAMSEQSVIGSVLMKPEILVDVMELIKPEDFYLYPHRAIFEAFVAIDESRRPVDPLVVAEYLSASGKLADVGGYAYLAELAHNTPSAINAMAYARNVKDKAREREVIAVAQAMQDEIRQPEHDTDTRINNAMAMPLVLETDNEPDKQTRDFMREALAELEQVHSGGGKLIGLTVGFKDLDERYNGLRGGQLMILAARPSMGKTTLALNICQATLFNDLPGAVPFFSLEMPGKALTGKLVCSISGADYEFFKKGSGERGGAYDDEQWQKINYGFRKLATAENLIVDERAGLTFQQIRSKCIRIKRKYGIVKAVFVDYLTLIQTPGKKSRTEEVGALSRGFKRLAKELDCPVILLAQLNRGLEQRTDKRPRMSDLRDSGEIEQDADIISFIYRDEVYNENSTRAGIAEIITAKNREGEIGTDYLRSDLARSRFRQLDQPFVPEAQPQEKKKYY